VARGAGRAAAVILGWAVAASSGEAADATHVLAGELARVNLARQSVVVKVPSPWREIEVKVDGDAVLSSAGRPLRLSDLRPGERVAIACADDAAGVHHARRVKLRGRPPSPSPR
jgi:hypothetical protein